MVPASSHRVSRVPWYSGSCRLCFGFVYGAFTLSGRSSQFRSTTFTVGFRSPKPRSARTPVWALPGSLAATSGIEFSFFSSGYLDVSVRRVPSVHLWIQCTVTGVFPAGFPHSDICGSLPICGSPQLFAACHVFLRPLVPRHPPRALLCLTCSLSTLTLFASSVALLRVPCFRPYSLPLFFYCLFSCLSTRLDCLACFGFSVFGFQGTDKQTYICLVEMEGFEPLTPCLQGRCSPN